MDLGSDQFLHQALLDKSEWNLVRAILKNLSATISWVHWDNFAGTYNTWTNCVYFQLYMMARGIKFGIEICLVLQYWADKAAATLLSCYAKVPVKNRLPVYKKENKHEKAKRNVPIRTICTSKVRIRAEVY